MHKAKQYYFLQDRAGAPHLILHLHHVQDTPQVHWEVLEEMCHSSIGKSDNPPYYRVAMHLTIAQKCGSGLRCLPILLSNRPAAIYVRSTLLKHHVKCIFPQGSFAKLALPQSIWDQRGVHSPLLSEQLVFHSQVSIQVTSWLPRAFQFGSSRVPHRVECRGLQSGWNASNSSQCNTVPQCPASPSQSHPLDLQTHLKRPHSLKIPPNEWMESRCHCDLLFESNSCIHYNSPAHTIFLLALIGLIKNPETPWTVWELSIAWWFCPWI